MISSNFILFRYITQNMSVDKIEFLKFNLDTVGIALQMMGAVVLTYFVIVKVKLQDEKRSKEITSKPPGEYKQGELSPMQYTQKKINEAINKKTRWGIVGFLLTFIGLLLNLIGVFIGYYCL